MSGYLFLEKKIKKDDLRLYNNPSTINDYLKIKYADDKKKALKKKSYIKYELPTTNISKILPIEFYNRIYFKNANKVDLIIHMLKSKYVMPSFNYSSYIHDQPVELKTFRNSRGAMLNMIFKIFYYHPLIIETYY